MKGVFLTRGEYTIALDPDKKWEFTPFAKPGDEVIAADWLGEVKEGWLPHKIMVPFSFDGSYTIKSIVNAGEYTVNDTIAVLINESGESINVTDFVLSNGTINLYGDKIGDNPCNYSCGFHILVFIIHIK
jgi:V/A-type H+-transporting ATPase subunit A